MNNSGSERLNFLIMVPGEQFINDCPMSTLEVIDHSLWTIAYG